MGGRSRSVEQKIESLMTYKEETVDFFSARFKKHQSRFKDGERIVKRFIDAANNVIHSKKLEQFSNIDEAHNEICIADGILFKSEPELISLEYEPKLSNTEKSVDFRAYFKKGITLYVDVKTIKPDSVDRWDQFEKANREKWFPPNVIVGFSRGDRCGKKDVGRGGYIWHDYVAARSKMIDYSLEFEQKIADARLMGENTEFILALCGEGYHWGMDELEDFVHYYRTGVYLNADGLSGMQKDHMKKKKKSFTRIISKFASMNRRVLDIKAGRLNWNVRPSPETLAYD